MSLLKVVAIGADQLTLFKLGAGGADIAQHNISYPPVSKSYVSAPLQYMCVTGPPKLIRTWGLDLLVGVV